MCEFCVKHGEGKKWYLEAKNYSDDLLSDIKRRKFIRSFFKHPEDLKIAVDLLGSLTRRAPSLVKNTLRWGVIHQMKKRHFGQIVPIEDVERIFELVNSVTRLSCICRYASLGKEARYCYALSLGPDGGTVVELFRGIENSFVGGPDLKGMEQLSKEEALNKMRGYEKEGLCHSVWTFMTPFIACICNCDRIDCQAMKTAVTHEVPLMFRAEYIAENDTKLCNGCRFCMKVCQFGAIGFSAATKKSVIDPQKCYGCGICRAVCKSKAIAIYPRHRHRTVANLW